MVDETFDARTRTGAPSMARAVPGSDGSFQGKENQRTYHTRDFMVPDPYVNGRELRVTATWDGGKWVVRDRMQAHDRGNEVAKYVYAPGPADG